MLGNELVRGLIPKLPPLCTGLSQMLASVEPPSLSRTVYRKPVSNAVKFSRLCPTGQSPSILDNTTAPKVNEPKSPVPKVSNAIAEVLFATHDTWGILDTGATQTVMGSQFVSGFLQNVPKHIRQSIRRCPCDVTFRFGNQGTLKSDQAMVVPVCGFDLKIAIVPGATPFLVSNTLLRALGAMLHTNDHQLILPRYSHKIPLKLSSKGLYLVDMNLLFQVPHGREGSRNPAETFAQETIKNIEAVPKNRDGVCPQNVKVERISTQVEKQHNHQVQTQKDHQSNDQETMQHEVNYHPSSFQFQPSSDVNQNVSQSQEHAISASDHAGSIGLKEPVQVNQQIPFTANMADWTKRLQRLQAAMPAAEAESIEHLTLEMLQNETVKFGKVHQGKTYAKCGQRLRTGSVGS